MEEIFETSVPSKNVVNKLPPTFHISFEVLPLMIYIVFVLLLGQGLIRVEDALSTPSASYNFTFSAFKFSTIALKVGCLVSVSGTYNTRPHLT